MDIDKTFVGGGCTAKQGGFNQDKNSKRHLHVGIKYGRQTTSQAYERICRRHSTNSVVTYVKRTSEIVDTSMMEICLVRQLDVNVGIYFLVFQSSV